MDNLFILFINAALINNLLLNYLFGVQDSITFSKRLNVAWWVGGGTCIISALSLPMNFLCHKFLLAPFSLSHIALIFYVVNIFLLFEIICYVFLIIWPSYFAQIDSLRPLVLLNNVVIGAVVFFMMVPDGVISAFFVGLGAGIGYALMLLVLTCLRERIVLDQVPIAFRGAPILLLTLAIVSMSFSGFSGIDK